MYVPHSFEQTDRDEILRAIRDYPFATLVTTQDGLPTATHLPLLIDPAEGELGTLHGHFARPNPQAQGGPRPALAIFHGPHAYVSARWYETPGTVPTWNYVAVHVTGTLETVDDEEQALAVLTRTAQELEPAADGWRVDPDSASIRGMMRGIVPFRLTITKLEGKWKLSQNHSVERRLRVITQLAGSAQESNRAVAELMIRALPDEVRAAATGSTGQAP